VPRNRHAIDRQDKIEEILRAAERKLQDGGYDDLSLGALASELNLARGALYWYFPTKDDLFVAAAGRVFAQALADPPTRAGHVRRITWAVEQLAGLEPVSAALHERSRHSQAAAELERAIQEGMCARLRDLLRGRVDDRRLHDVADAIVVFVQGLLAMPLDATQRAARLRFLLGELVPS
jgi:AcrR family transcriptional regulator